MENKYIDIFKNIEEFLENNKKNDTKLSKKFPFRKRSDHIWRVFVWTVRLLDQIKNDTINKNVIFIAALFHDVGYGISEDSKNHAENSVIIFENYCKKLDLNKEEENLIKFLIKNHSNKKVMEDKNIPIELTILMEADLLDETGAMSIVWDCMAEGSEEEQNFQKTYEHIKKNSCKILEQNPMKTQIGKEIWEKKQKLVKEFSEQLFFDLCK